MAKVMKIEYNKGKHKSHRYVLECDPQSSKEDLVVFDITNYLKDENSADSTDGFDTETGPRFGFGVHNALKAGQLQSTAMAGWKKSPDETYKPKIGFDGTWKIYKLNLTTVLKEWSWEA